MIVPVFHQRRDWTRDHRAPEHSPAARQQLGPRADMYVHHSAGLGLSIDTHREQVSVMRAIWHLHVRVNGWDDFAYSFAVFPPHGRLRRGRIYVGRGWRRIPASQRGCNAGNWSVVVIGNFDRERPDRATLDALRWLRRRALRERFGAEVKGHRECAGRTACPGRHLFAALDRID